MMRTYLMAVALSALSFARAEMHNFTFNPDEVTLSTKAAWCQAEINTCGTLCVTTPTANDCSPTDLTYHCTCANGSAPGLEYYTQTIYSFECQQLFTDCINQNAGNAKGQTACKTDIQAYCGTLDPTKFQPGSETSSSSSSSSAAATTSAASATGTAASSASASGTAVTTSSSKAGAPTAAYLGNGAAVVAAGIFAALL